MTIAAQPPPSTVSSVTGAANEITASPTTGAVVLTLPNVIIIPSGATSGASLQLPASTTSAAPLHFTTTGAAAPTTPTGGDIWDVNAVLTLYGNSKFQNILTDGGNTLGFSQIPVITTSFENQLVTEGPTIDGSGNINSVQSITGTGNATFNSFITAPGSGAGIGSIQLFTTGASPIYSVTVTPAAAPASNFTLSLPDVEANDTLASLGFAQTLSSKTLNNAAFVDGAHGNATLFSTAGVASAVNYWQIGNAATGSGVQMSAVGTDTNITATIAAQGTGSVTSKSNGAAALTSTNVSSSAVNYAAVFGSVSGNAVAYSAGGTDSNINVSLVPKGSGGVLIKSSLRTATYPSTDLAGQFSLSGGTNSISFTGTYATAPICVATDISAIAAVQVVVTTTTLTVKGTGSDTINYICIGRT